MAELKNTPLREFHLEMGAKMVPRSGWNLPLNFSEGAVDEHESCCSGAALFDFCADGRIRMAFPGASEALKQLLCENALPFSAGSCRRELLLGEDGAALAFCRISLMAEDDFFISIPFQSADRVKKLFEQKNMEYTDLSEYLCCIGIAGPESRKVLTLCGVAEEALPGKGETKLLELDGLRAVVSFSDDLNDEGFELNFNAECADQIWDLLLDTDIPWPAGLAAQDSLRMERSLPGAAELLIPRRPSELSTCLGRVIFSGRRAPFAGVRLFDRDGTEKGIVTSGCFCPLLGSACALAFFPEGVPGGECGLSCDASGVTVTGFPG